MSAATPERVSEPGVWVTARLVQLCGNANVARFLAQCLYWSNTELVERRQGWFYKSRQEWQQEVWLSRYQQEKARQWLRDHKLLQERHERRQDGIRLWFRLDRMLLNTLLNQLADQTQQEEGEAVDVSDSVDVSTLTEQSENNTTTVVNHKIDIEESRAESENETIVPIYRYIRTIKGSFIGEISTNVSDNIDTKTSVNSHSFCVDSDVECDTADHLPVETETPSLPSVLTCRSDNTAPVEHNTRLADYQCCHPFIYQFLKTRILTGYGWSEAALNLFREYGLEDEILLDALGAFIRQWGPSLVRYYQGMAIDCPELTEEDVELAVWVSRYGADKRP